MGEHQRRLTLPKQRRMGVARQPIKASQLSGLTCLAPGPFSIPILEPRGPMMMNNSTHEFNRLLGKAVLALWSDFPRDVQENLFETAVAGDGIIRNHLASYLHEHHRKTAHPAKPKQLA